MLLLATRVDPRHGHIREASSKGTRMCGAFKARNGYRSEISRIAVAMTLQHKNNPATTPKTPIDMIIK